MIAQRRRWQTIAARARKRAGGIMPATQWTRMDTLHCFRKCKNNLICLLHLSGLGEGTRQSVTLIVQDVLCANTYQ